LTPGMGWNTGDEKEPGGAISIQLPITYSLSKT